MMMCAMNTELPPASGLADWRLPDEEVQPFDNDALVAFAEGHAKEGAELILVLAGDE